MEVSDQELIRSAVAGDDSAFHTLVDRHAPVLFRAALSLSRNRADAEDLLQETFIAAHRGLKQFEGRSSVRTWLQTILTRKSYKARHRSRHQRATLSIDAMDSAPLPAAADGGMLRGSSSGAVDQRIDVMQVLQTLSDPHRQVLVLREIQGLSYEEIAAALGVPRGTAESRLYRARAEFREKFGPQ